MVWDLAIAQPVQKLEGHEYQVGCGPVGRGWALGVRKRHSAARTSAGAGARRREAAAAGGWRHGGVVAAVAQRGSMCRCQPKPCAAQLPSTAGHSRAKQGRGSGRTSPACIAALRRVQACEPLASTAPPHIHRAPLASTHTHRLHSSPPPGLPRSLPCWSRQRVTLCPPPWTKLSASGATGSARRCCRATRLPCCACCSCPTATCCPGRATAPSACGRAASARTPSPRTPTASGARRDQAARGGGLRGMRAPAAARHLLRAGGLLSGARGGSQRAALHASRRPVLPYLPTWCPHATLCLLRSL